MARKRDPLRGTAEIALAVGKVINQHKVAKHFDLDIADVAFSFTRKTTQIAAEAAIDGVYVIRTSLPAETFRRCDDGAQLQVTRLGGTSLSLHQNRRSARPPGVS